MPVSELTAMWHVCVFLKSGRSAVWTREMAFVCAFLAQVAEQYMHVDRESWLLKLSVGFLFIQGRQNRKCASQENRHNVIKTYISIFKAGE